MSMIQKSVDKSHIKALKLKKYIPLIDMFLSCLFSNLVFLMHPLFFVRKLNNIVAMEYNKANSFVQ